MAVFTVRKRVDAYAVYVAEVEATSAEEAAKIARQTEDSQKWREETFVEFDARSFVALNADGEEIEETSQGDRI
jgi:hypothetical protein